MPTVNSLFRLQTLLKPGGLRERTTLLLFLHGPGVARSPEEGVSLLRKWHDGLPGRKIWGPPCPTLPSACQAVTRCRGASWLGDSGAQGVIRIRALSLGV